MLLNKNAANIVYARKLLSKEMLHSFTREVISINKTTIMIIMRVSKITLDAVNDVGLIS